MGTVKTTLTGVLCAAAFAVPAMAGMMTEAEKLLASDGVWGDLFGSSVSVSGDTALVGAQYDDDNGSWSGSAYVFVRSGTTWTEQAKLTASDGAADDLFGCSVSVSGDTAVVGAYWDHVGASVNQGSAYVFVRSGSTWTEQAKLTASDGEAEDRFGFSVSMNGDTAVVGAHGNDDSGIESGSAYVFVRSGSVWTEQAKLTAFDGALQDYFGYSVSVSGDTAVLGAIWDDDNGNRSGSAYVHVRSGSTWTEQAKLVASDGAAGDRFGYSVSVSGDTAVVGADYGNGIVVDSGSAYIFVRSGTTWTEQAKLTASDGAADDNFGGSVSLSGETAIVGARRDGDSGSDSGSAYVFVRNGSTWMEQVKLTASDGAAGDEFGCSVSAGDDTAIVGAHADDDNGQTSGSAYVFASDIAVSLPPSAVEGDGTLVDQGAVSISWARTADLLIDLESSDETELTVPLTVTIPQGETSAAFDLTIVDDGVHDGTQTVTVTATAAGLTSGSAEMDVIYKAVTPFAGGCAVFHRRATASAGSAAALLLAAAVIILALGRRSRLARVGRRASAS